MKSQDSKQRVNRKIVALCAVIAALAILFLILCVLWARDAGTGAGSGEEAAVTAEATETPTPEATVEVTAEATETPTPEPTVAGPVEATEEERELLLEETINYAMEGDASLLAGVLRYRGEDGTIQSYTTEELQDLITRFNESESSSSAFLTYLQSEEVTAWKSGDESYFILPVATVAEIPLGAASTGYKVAIDAGHQAQGNSEQEPIGPGAQTTKAKVASGTSGRTSGVPEYQLNLDVSLKLRDELLSRGYEVYMIRETNDVDISNAERAQLAAESGADIFIRIHANGSDNTSVSGALTMAPSLNNSYVGSELAAQCQSLSQAVITAYCEATGANNQGVYQTDEMSGLNWCTIPATIVELGYMTNPDEDLLMQTDDYQNKMVQGIANGIDQYFASAG